MRWLGDDSGGVAALYRRRGAVGECGGLNGPSWESLAWASFGSRDDRVVKFLRSFFNERLGNPIQLFYNLSLPSNGPLGTNGSSDE